MNINRHNYDEFFLLYTDNELQPEDRRQVEEFAAQNPDLADELNLLQQTVLPQYDIHFDNKEQLFKKEDGISAANCEEYFLLYADNELSDKEKNEVETFVLQHPALQKDFTLVKQAKLQAPQIIFEDKNSLYRSEKIRRNVPVLWMRMGVAAAIMGLVTFTWIFTQNQQTANNINVANTYKAVQQQKKNIIVTGVTNPDTASLQIKATADNAEQILTPQKVKNTAPQKINRRNIPVETQQNVALQQQKSDSRVQNKEIENPAAVKEDKNIYPNRNESLAQNKANKDIDENGSANEILKQARNQNMDGQPTLVSNAVYRELDTNEDDRNLYIGSAAINKNKIKGLFKKAASLFGKSKNNEDETNR